MTRGGGGDLLHTVCCGHHEVLVDQRASTEVFAELLDGHLPGSVTWIRILAIDDEVTHHVVFPAFCTWPQTNK